MSKFKINEKNYNKLTHLSFSLWVTAEEHKKMKRLSKANKLSMGQPCRDMVRHCLDDLK